MQRTCWALCIRDPGTLHRGLHNLNVVRDRRERPLALIVSVLLEVNTSFLARAPYGLLCLHTMTQHVSTAPQAIRREPETVFRSLYRQNARRKGPRAAEAVEPSRRMRVLTSIASTEATLPTQALNVKSCSFSTFLTSRRPASRQQQRWSGVNNHPWRARTAEPRLWMPTQQDRRKSPMFTISVVREWTALRYSPTCARGRQAQHGERARRCCRQCRRSQKRLTSPAEVPQELDASAVRLVARLDAVAHLLQVYMNRRSGAAGKRG